MSGEISRKAAQRRTGESAYFNLHTLRRLYNPANSGRGTEGLKSRYDLHPTITHLTYLLLTRAVPVGKGSYGSPVIELAIRLMVTVVCRAMPIEKVAEELALSVLDRASLVQNLQALAQAVQLYSLKEDQTLTEKAVS